MEYARSECCTIYLSKGRTPRSSTFDKALDVISSLEKSMLQTNAGEKTKKLVNDIHEWMFLAENAIEYVSHSLVQASKHVKAEVRQFQNLIMEDYENRGYYRDFVMHMTDEQRQLLASVEGVLGPNIQKLARYVIQCLVAHIKRLKELITTPMIALDNWLRVAAHEIEYFAADLHEKSMFSPASPIFCDSTQLNDYDNNEEVSNLSELTAFANDALLYADNQWEKCKARCMKKLRPQLTALDTMIDEELLTLEDQDDAVTDDIIDWRNAISDLRDYVDLSFFEGVFHDFMNGALNGACSTLEELQDNITDRFDELDKNNADLS